MAFVVSVSALLLAWGAAVNLVGWLNRRYVRANLSAAALLCAWALSRGLDWPDLGLDPARVATGARWGLAAAAVIAAALGGAVAAPRIRPALRDERAAGMSGRALVRWALIRIPLGTVVLEEVAFRGVLLAAWANHAGPGWAVLGSSAVFGLWHAVPTVRALRLNRPAASPATMAWGVAAGMAATGIAGAALCGLRLVSGSLAAPALAHTASNSLSVAAAAAAHRWAHRRTWRRLR